MMMKSSTYPWFDFFKSYVPKTVIALLKILLMLLYLQICIVGVVRKMRHFKPEQKATLHHDKNQQMRKYEKIEESSNGMALHSKVKIFECIKCLLKK